MVIVAAVDRSDRAPSVVTEAETLANAFDETVHVVNVLTRSEFVDLGVSSAKAERSVSVDEIRGVATDYAESLSKGLDREYEAVGLMGREADRVVEYAAEHSARYIVVGPRKRSPAGKAVFGSTAQDIILNADRPVVTTIKQ